MSRPIGTFLVAFLVACAAPAMSNAQSANADARRDQRSPLMTPGARVRVKLPGEHVWTGTLVSLSDDTMFVRSASGHDTTLVRLSRVTQLQVSAGKRRSRHVVRNTVIGAVAGGGLGRLIGGAMTSGGCSKFDPCWETNWCFLCTYVNSTPVPPVTDRGEAGMLIGGVAGSVLGLLVSRIRTEDWRPVSIPAPRRTAVRLSARGAGVAIAF